MSTSPSLTPFNLAYVMLHTHIIALAHDSLTHLHALNTHSTCTRLPSTPTHVPLRPTRTRTRTLNVHVQAGHIDNHAHTPTLDTHPGCLMYMAVHAINTHPGRLDLAALSLASDSSARWTCFLFLSLAPSLPRHQLPLLTPTPAPAQHAN